jgi:hypothetical protein
MNVFTIINYNQFWVNCALNRKPRNRLNFLTFGLFYVHAAQWNGIRASGVSVCNWHNEEKHSMYGLTQIRSWWMRVSTSLLMTLLLLVIAPTFAQTTPQITAFTADRAAITPDEAESGGVYANLKWTTSGLIASDSVHLQVFVLGAWHDALPDNLDSNGSLRWAVPHTLDFASPTFRLIIRDGSGRITTTRELIIPYAAATGTPEISAFTSSVTLVKESALRAGNTLHIAWHIRNRPPRANIVFEQILDNGERVSIELPRTNRWIRSSGEGQVKPKPDGNAIVLRAKLVNIDTGELYVEKSLTIAVDLTPQPTPIPGTQPEPTATVDPNAPKITSFTATNYMPKRGETYTINWATSNADKVSIQIFDVDYFPRSYMPAQVIHEFADLPAQGSLNLTIPADYGGAGWQVHLTASKNGNPPYDGKRLDFILSDMKQMILLNVRKFTVTPANARRGDTVTITWEGLATTRVSRNGVSSYDEPISGYENKVGLNLVIFELPRPDGPSPSNTLAYRDLPLSGTITVVIPLEQPPELNHIQIELGMDVDGTYITYDIASVELMP